MYGQIRLEKAYEYCPLAGGYNILPSVFSKSSDHSRILSVIFLRMFISIMVRRSEDKIKSYSIYGVYIGSYRSVMFVPVSGVLVRSPIDSNVASRMTRIRKNMKNYKHLKLNLKRIAEEIIIENVLNHDTLN